MLEEHAIILSLEADTEQTSIATLEIARKTACGLCGKTRGCGNSIWGKLFAHRPTSFKAQNRINAKVGDSVIVGIDESAVMKSALLLYMLPLATMFAVAAVVSQVTHVQWMVLLGSIVGLILGFVWVKGYSLTNPYFRLHQPTILRLDDTQPIEFKIN